MIEAVGIIIPAHDEEDRIAACVTAVERARARVPREVETHVVVVLDDCSDDTCEHAMRAFSRSYDCVAVSCANVGRARAHGASALLQHFAHRDRSRVWLATTDADSEVPASWLQDHLQVATSGYAALAGTVQVEDWHLHGYDASNVRTYEEYYRQGGDLESHPHVHGANLGVRADAYAAVGGFPPLATGEDHALWNTLKQRGFRALATRRVQVVTSARVAARAPLGFAHFLAELSASTS